MSRRAGCDIVILSRYGALGASSRVRLLVYKPWLEARGLSVDVQELLPDRYVQRLYFGSGRDRREVAVAYLRRLAYILMRKRPGAIWLEKELWPYVPWTVEALALGRVPLVLDIDDAVFHDYDESASRLVRWFLGYKLDRMFGRAALVTAGSSYLLQRATKAGARWGELVPTVVDLAQYVWAREHLEGFTVGWIGSPATQRYLQPIAPVLSQSLSEKHSRLITIGTSYQQKLFEHHEQQEWNKDTEARQLARLDVGIMPLPDGPFERGKCGYKLVQYMASGLPVVASPVGVNKEIVRHGENGFLAETSEEWRAALRVLKNDRDLRARMGAAGRRDVERRFSLQVTGPKVANWLAHVAASNPLNRTNG